MNNPITKGAVERVASYDAGLLSDYGGGNVEWWQDYIRAELARAHDFYESQLAPPGNLGELVTALEELRKAHDAFMSAYRARHSSGKGVRPNAPLRDEVSELNTAIITALARFRGASS